MKKYLNPIFIFVAGGAVGLFLGAGFLSGFFPQAALISGSTASPSPEVSPVSSPEVSPGSWESVVQEGARSAVIIQVFQGERLTKTAGGALVSADGLIASISDLIPGGSQYIYQIAYEDKILRGKLIFRSLQNNLVLLSVEGADFNIANFDELAVIQSGQEVVMAAKTLDVSKPALFSQRGMVSQSSGRLFTLDTPSAPALNGAQAFASTGKSLGLSFLRSGKVWLIPSSTVTQFVSEQLSTSQ